MVIACWDTNPSIGYSSVVLVHVVLQRVRLIGKIQSQTLPYLGLLQARTQFVNLDCPPIQQAEQFVEPKNVIRTPQHCSIYLRRISGAHQS